MTVINALDHLDDMVLIDQRLARMGLELDNDDREHVHSFSAPRISVDGNVATASYYLRKDNPQTGKLDGLAYGIARFGRSGDDWLLVERDEVPTGNSAGPRRMLEGLAQTGTDLEAYGGGTDDAETLLLLDKYRVRNILGSYGLAADSGTTEAVVPLFCADASLDIEGELIVSGRNELIAMFQGRGHISLMPWSAHTMGPSLIRVDGDEAISVHYTRTYAKLPRPANPGTLLGPAASEPDDRGLMRYSVNRWRLRREEDGRWRIFERISRSPNIGEMRDILGDAVRSADMATSVRRTGIGQIDRLSDLSAVSDLVIWSGMALDAGGLGTGVAHCFDASPEIVIDGVPVVPDEIAAALAVGLTAEVVGHIPNTPVIRLRGDEATAIAAMHLYERGNDGGFRLGGIRYARWTARRGSDGRWRATALTVCRAEDDASTAIILEALA
jgi:hypothetical protein